MRLLLDNNLSPVVAEKLRDAGHDATHVRDHGLQQAADDEILQLALADGRVLVSEDTDFGALLSRTGARAPSFLLLRTRDPLTPDQQAELIVANLPHIAPSSRVDASPCSPEIECASGHSPSSDTFAREIPRPPRGPRQVSRSGARPSNTLTSPFVVGATGFEPVTSAV